MRKFSNFVGNKAIGRISKRMLQGNKARQIFSKNVLGGKKCSFFEKFGVLCFLVTPVLKFALLPYCQQFMLFIADLFFIILDSIIPVKSGSVFFFLIR